MLLLSTPLPTSPPHSARPRPVQRDGGKLNKHPGSPSPPAAALTARASIPGPGVFLRVVSKHAGRGAVCANTMLKTTHVSAHRRSHSPRHLFTPALALTSRWCFLWKPDHTAGVEGGGGVSAAGPVFSAGSWPQGTVYAHLNNVHGHGKCRSDGHRTGAPQSGGFLCPLDPARGRPVS